MSKETKEKFDNAIEKISDAGKDMVSGVSDFYGSSPYSKDQVEAAKDIIESANNIADALKDRYDAINEIIDPCLKK